MIGYTQSSSSELSLPTARLKFQEKTKSKHFSVKIATDVFYDLKWFWGLVKVVFYETTIIGLYTVVFLDESWREYIYIGYYVNFGGCKNGSQEAKRK